MKLFIIALVSALVFVPVSSMAGVHYNGDGCTCGYHMEKGEPTAARGSIYDMASHNTCEKNEQKHD